MTAPTRFPPFPDAPANANIVPFDEWDEFPQAIRCYGYSQEIASDVIEIDGLGVPTVPLQWRHSTDRCKSDATKVPTSSSSQRPPPPRPRFTKGGDFWKAWEEGDAEERRFAVGVDMNASLEDRIFSASFEFKRGRFWPRRNMERKGDLGAIECWDQFCLFAGLLRRTPIWEKEDGDKDVDVSDDEPEPQSIIVSGPVYQDKPRPPVARAPYWRDQTGVTIVQSDDDIQTLLSDANQERIRTLQWFLSDIEGRVKLFLSAYICAHNLDVAAFNKRAFPKLISFFLRFLIRSHIFAPPSDKPVEVEVHDPEVGSIVKHVVHRPSPGESAQKTSAQRALAICYLAFEELPLASSLCKAITEDPWNRACSSYWGYKDPQSMHYRNKERNGWEDEEFAEVGAKRKSSSPDDGDDDREPFDMVDDASASSKGKKRKGDGGITYTPGDGAHLAEEAGVSIPDEILTDLLDAIENTSLASPDSGVWLNADDGFEAIHGDKPHLDALAALNEIWDYPKPSLTDFLDLTSLPVKYITGIVERSIRRIVSVHPPSLSGPAAGAVDANVAGPEGLFAEKFARVILAAWIGDNAEPTPDTPYLHPEILDTSEGTVSWSSEGAVDVDGDVDMLGSEDELPVTDASTTNGRKAATAAHNPLRDSITLLVNPNLVDLFQKGIGMGLGATWVELVPSVVRLSGVGGKGPSSVENSSQSTGVKIQKKVAVPKERVWYLENLDPVLVSFYTQEGMEYVLGCGN